MRKGSCMIVEKNNNFNKKASGFADIPRLDLRDLSIESAKKIFRYLNGQEAKSLTMKFYKAKDVTKKEFPFVVAVDIAENEGTLTDQGIYPSHDLGVDHLTNDDEIILIRCFLNLQEIFEDPSNISEVSLAEKIYEFLTHEITHAMDIDICHGHSSQKERYKRLYNIEDEGDPRFGFYFTTREEVKANISQIISQLEGLVSNDPSLLTVDFETIIRQSRHYREIMGYLIVKPGDEEIKVIQGTLAQRKARAKKQIISGVFAGWSEIVSNAKKILASYAKANMLKQLIKTANELDKRSLTKEADALDNIILKHAAVDPGSIANALGYTGKVKNSIERYLKFNVSYKL